jgi:hypothetical protein
MREVRTAVADCIIASELLTRRAGIPPLLLLSHACAMKTRHKPHDDLVVNGGAGFFHFRGLRPTYGHDHGCR